MDELEISGKRYLSSRRAAKDHGYHSDYIGQLIRSGRVVGSKVGRTWYVEEESLIGYLMGEAGGSTVGKVTGTPSEAVIESPKLSYEEPSAMLAPATEPNTSTPFSTIPVSSPVEEVRTLPVTTLSRESEIQEVPLRVSTESKIQSNLIEERSIPIQKMGLRYIPDDEPLLPEIRSITRMPEESRHIQKAPTPAMSTPIVHKTQRSFLPAVVVILIGLFVVGGVTFASAVVKSDMSIQAGQPAAVWYSIH